MAVVSISRIQIRRGQKNEGSGLPQLASGELGWAIDTRELFIGNGSVAEGAPAVGNTKIITEYDDIFTLADTYTYRSTDGFVVTGSNASAPVNRSLQQRLDDRVSVKSFGAKGDGITDDTASLQRALDQLYLNEATKSNPESRVVLHIEPGVYNITNTLYIPPYATLKAAGSDKTIIKQTQDVEILKTVNSASEPGLPADSSTTTYDNQARKIYMEGMTLESTTLATSVDLENCRDSKFKDVKIVGIWSAGTPLDTENTGLIFNNSSSAIGSSYNDFENCRIENFSYAAISNWDITNNHFDRCVFRNLGNGFVFGTDMVVGDTGQIVGPSHTTVSNSVFENINRTAIYVENGEYNLSESNRYLVVGTNSGPETNAVYPAISYISATNKSNHDYFSRTEALISGTSATVPYIPEIEGTAMYELKYEHEQEFGALNNVRLFRLPGVQNQSYELDYTIVSNFYRVIRSGTMTIVVDAVQNNVDVSDDYDFVGDEDYLDDINFRAQLRDANGDGAAETIDMRVVSTMPNDDESVIKFTIKAKKTNTP